MTLDSQSSCWSSSQAARRMAGHQKNQTVTLVTLDHKLTLLSLFNLLINVLQGLILLLSPPCLLCHVKTHIHTHTHKHIHTQTRTYTHTHTLLIATGGLQYALNIIALGHNPFLLTTMVQPS